MTFQDFKNKWIAFIDKMNRLGVPVPTVRDPKTGQGSITAALLVFSAGLFGLCILCMLGAGVAKLAGVFVLNDATAAQVKMAADYSFQFLLAALGGYLGRYMQKGPSTQVSVENPAQPAAQAKTPKADDPDQQ